MLSKINYEGARECISPIATTQAFGWNLVFYKI